MNEGRVKGREDPSWIAEKPELMPGDSAVLRGFWILDTERGPGANGLGRIPWSKCVDYYERLGYERDVVDVMWLLISALDGVYREWMNKEYERETRRQRGAAQRAAARGKFGRGASGRKGVRRRR